MAVGFFLIQTQRSSNCGGFVRSFGLGANRASIHFRARARIGGLFGRIRGNDMPLMQDA
jgi:hypothetical protein